MQTASRQLAARACVEAVLDPRKQPRMVGDMGVVVRQESAEQSVQLRLGQIPPGPREAALDQRRAPAPSMERAFDRQRREAFRPAPS